MAAYVYVLCSADARGPITYVGWTNDLDRRLKRHNAGAGAKSTRGRAWVLVYAERHDSRGAALRREWALKRDRDFRARLRAATAPV